MSRFGGLDKGTMLRHTTHPAAHPTPASRPHCAPPRVLLRWRSGIFCGSAPAIRVEQAVCHGQVSGGAAKVIYVGRGRKQLVLVGARAARLDQKLLDEGRIQLALLPCELSARRDVYHLKLLVHVRILDCAHKVSAAAEKELIEDVSCLAPRLQGHKTEQSLGKCCGQSFGKSFGEACEYITWAPSLLFFERAPLNDSGELSFPSPRNWCQVLCPAS